MQRLGLHLRLPVSLLALTNIGPASGENATDATTCNCDGCPNAQLVALGLHKEVVSPSCPEGQVAAVTTLRSIDDSGVYKVVTWNTGSYSNEAGIGAVPYVYRQATTTEDVTCYEVDQGSLPVIGDQREIKVTLNCESITFCQFKWDIQFGCGDTGVTDPENGGLQVLSDVDDTVTCSNPSTTCDSLASCAQEGTASAYLGGVDRRLEHGEMYPGAAQLMMGLALGGGNGNGGRYLPAKPMFLSARPREAESFLSINQDSEINLYLETTGERHGHDTWGANVDDSMYGTLLDGTSFKEFGQTKGKHYNSISAERPTTRFAFLGDTGQGDPCGAQSMLESDAGDRMAAVLLHEVQNRTEAHAECESPGGNDFALDLPEGDRVHYFRTYSDAALWSHERGLISCCAASNVRFAVDEWHACRCRGECPPGGLPTGVSERATREETLSYCDEVGADQGLLADAVAACDPAGLCPAPKEYEQPASGAVMGTYLSDGAVLGAVLGLLQFGLEVV